MDFERYLTDLNFDKQLNRLKKSLKDKRIVIYGSGELFQFINKNYDLSDLNIVGISDGKYSDEDNGKDFMNYRIVSLNNIPELKPDYVIVAILNYIEIQYDLKNVYLKNADIKVIPFVQKRIGTVLKSIWLS